MMTKEKLKQKAKDFIDRINKESDGMWLNNYYLSDLLVMFATEATKELQEENAELKGKLVLSDMVLTDKTKRIKELENKLMDKVCLESLDIVSAKIKDLEKENAELKKLFADCDTCKRTCDIGNCCKFGSAYLPDVEKVLNEQKQLTKAKEIIKELLSSCFGYNSKTVNYEAKAKAEQFLKEE